MNIDKMFCARILALATSTLAISGCNLVDSDSPAELTEGTSVNPVGGRGGPIRGSAPAIWGTPRTAAAVEAPYEFQPYAADADGDVLQFTVQNKPSWANFNSQDGRLSGRPSASDVGQNRNIVISVTDGSSIVSLPSFSIGIDEANSNDGGGGSTDGGGDTGGDGGTSGGGDGEPAPQPSDPPSLSGQPNRSVVIDTEYVFQPDASDPDGDDLSFSIVNRPSWANFDTTTGRLRGTPSASDIGTTQGIEISVSDATSTVALLPFSIAVEPIGTTSFTVFWNAPTTNEDGSALTDLSGYLIHYGTATNTYTETIVIDSPGILSYVIENMTPGTYYLAMTSKNANGIESVYSGELVFEIGN